MTIAAVVPAFFGISLLFTPASLMETNGLVVNDSALLFARSVGGMLLGVAVINWRARKDEGSDTLWGIMRGNIGIHVLALITDVSAIYHHVITKNPAFSIVVHVFFIVAFGYFYLGRQSSAQSKVG